MRSLLDRYEFLHTPPAAVLVTLGGGFFVWVAWRVWLYGHPWLCAGAMGFLSGVAGAGGVMLLVDLLTALMPAGGITSTIGSVARRGSVRSFRGERTPGGLNRRQRSKRRWDRFSVFSVTSC